MQNSITRGITQITRESSRQSKRQEQRFVLDNAICFMPRHGMPLHVVMIKRFGVNNGVQLNTH